jgi:DNA-binding transcriptional LysR family regulator
VLLVPKDHPLASRDSVALSEAANEPFIFTEPSEIYEETHNMCRSAGFGPNTLYESQVCLDAIYMVEAGLGVALAAEFTWLQGVNIAVVALPITDQKRGRYLYARFLDGLAPSESTWKFINYMQDYANELVGKPSAQ